MTVPTITLSEQERALLSAALLYFCRRAEEAHLLEELSAPLSTYKDVQAIATMSGRVSPPTIDSIRELQTRIAGTIAHCGQSWFCKVVCSIPL
jgi:hypothetical protein